MGKEWKEFEKTYEWLYNIDKEKYKVTHSAKLYDYKAEENREVDVLVEFKDKAGENRKLAIECRYRKNKQDVIWIEQLQQKKEDMKLDYILATTTTDFSKGAINKAKAHGVIIEKANLFGINTLEQIRNNEYFFDLNFLKMQFVELLFYDKNDKIIVFKEFFNIMPIVDKYSILNELNKELYISICPNTIFDQMGVSKDELTKKGNDIVLEKICIFENKIPDIFKKYNIKCVKYKLRLIPFSVSLLLDKSISVLNVEDNRNKNYRALYGNEEECIDIGYVDGQGYANIKVKKRKYMRLIGLKGHLNTIFPKTVAQSINAELENNRQDLIGEFDFSKII